jgi:hypothetical protein
MDTVRYVYLNGGMYPALMLVVSNMIESLVRVGSGLRWKARFVDCLDGSVFAISASGYCVTLVHNPDYFRNSNYMRALSERVSGRALLLAFSIMGVLSLASLILRNSARVGKRCDQAPTGRFCWCVYIAELVNRGWALFCLAFWAAENWYSVSAYNPGNYPPFTAFFVAAAIASLLIGVSLPAPGREGKQESTTGTTGSAATALPAVSTRGRPTAG